MMARALQYRIVKAADSGPLVVIDSPLGNGQELRPDATRRLAEALLRIAAEADARDMGDGYAALTGKTEF